MTFFEDELLIVFHDFNKLFGTIFPFDKEVRTVFSGTFFQPHVIVNGGCNQVAPPMVPEFMTEQITIGYKPFSNHELRIGNVGWDFKRTIRGKDIANTLPSVWSPPVFQRVNGKPQLLKFIRHGIDLLGLSGESNRNVTVVSGVHIIGIHVRRHRNR